MAGRPSTRYEEKLIEYLDHQDLKNFRALLRRKDRDGQQLVDPNHEFRDPYYNTLLGRACQKENFEESAEFIRVLLDNGADPNVKCQIINTYAAIHFAAEKNNLPALKVLLAHSDINPNILSQGHSALYLSATKLPKTETTFKYLATHPKISAKFDIGRRTAIGEAARKKCKREILEDVLNRTHYLRPDDKQLIKQNYPDLDIPDIPEDVGDDNIPTELYNFLYTNDINTFTEKVSKDYVNSSTTLPKTFLQLACEKGIFEIVQLLVDLEADIDSVGLDEERPPIHLACFYGHFKILRFLKQKHAKIGIVKQKSLLHSVMEGLGSKLGGNRQHTECFDYLLEKNNELRIPINFGDEFGHTALHYAVMEEDDHFVKKLLEKGAYIGTLNIFNVSPLNDIEPSILNEALDNSIQRVETDKNSNIYKLRVNFQILKPSECSAKSTEINISYKSGFQQATNGESVSLIDVESPEGSKEELPEMFPLFYISHSNKLRHLIKHPVFLIFLHFKWNRICLLSYLNTLFYTVFVTFLTAYILCNSCTECGSQSTVCNPRATAIIRIILIVLFFGFIFRELMQFILLPDKAKYIKNLENFLEIGIIITTAATLTGYCSNFLTAITLLLSWTEVILQFGYIYTLAIYNEMMKRVSWNYLKFLSCYSPLIIAFTFSFYRLYHSEDPPEKQVGTFVFRNFSGNYSFDEAETDFYSDFAKSLLKTVVMMIGEFDASGMSFSHGGYILFFIFFVFLITIVLLNLLNGLAVSDTQAIRNDAELVAHCFKVNMIYHFENVLFGRPLRGLMTNLPWRRHLLGKLTLFPKVLPDDTLTIIMKQNKLIGRYEDPTYKTVGDKEYRPDQCCSFGTRRYGLPLDPDILEAAKDIAERKGELADDTKKQVEQMIHEIQELKILEAAKDKAERKGELSDESKKRFEQINYEIKELKSNISELKDLLTEFIINNRSFESV